MPEQTRKSLRKGMKSDDLMMQASEGRELIFPALL